MSVNGTWDFSSEMYKSVEEFVEKYRRTTKKKLKLKPEATTSPVTDYSTGLTTNLADYTASLVSEYVRRRDSFQRYSKLYEQTHDHEYMSMRNAFALKLMDLYNQLNYVKELLNGRDLILEENEEEQLSQQNEKLKKENALLKAEIKKQKEEYANLKEKYDVLDRLNSGRFSSTVQGGEKPNGQ